MSEKSDAEDYATDYDNYWSDKDPPLDRKAQIELMVTAKERHKQNFLRLIKLLESSKDNKTWLKLHNTKSTTAK